MISLRRVGGIRKPWFSQTIPDVDAAAFVDKWRMSRRSERSASQEHFLDLCELLHNPKPGAIRDGIVAMVKAASGALASERMRDR
jgi:hypothetical protein